MGVWIEHQYGHEWRDDDVILSQGDSSSVTGWLTRSSFGDECPLHLALARSLSKYLMDHRISHFSQWFPGRENSVADCLSRDFHLSDNDVISHIRRRFTKQIPQHFRLITLPPVIITSVGDLLRLLPKGQQLPLEPTRSGVEVGLGTKGSSMSWESVTTRSSRKSEPQIGLNSSHVSQPPSVRGGHSIPESLLNLALDARQAQFVPPSTGWHRPIGLTNLSARCTTVEDGSSPFWPTS